MDDDDAFLYGDEAPAASSASATSIRAAPPVPCVTPSHKASEEPGMQASQIGQTEEPPIETGFQGGETSNEHGEKEEEEEEEEDDDDSDSVSIL